MPLTIVGTKGGLGKKLRMVADNAEDVMPMWEDFGQYLSRQVMRQFSSEGAFFGTPWPRLTPEYAAKKRAAGYRGKILVREGWLKRSFMWPMDIFVVTPNRAEFGSSLDTAVWHHHGTKKGGRQINPPRPILELTPQMEKWAVTLLKRHLTEGI